MEITAENISEGVFKIRLISTRRHLQLAMFPRAVRGGRGPAEHSISVARERQHFERIEKEWSDDHPIHTRRVGWKEIETRSRQQNRLCDPGVI